MAELTEAEKLDGLTNDPLKPGLHEALLTRRLEELLAQLADGTLLADVAELRDAEASDRVSRHLAGMSRERSTERRKDSEATRHCESLPS